MLKFLIELSPGDSGPVRWSLSACGYSHIGLRDENQDRWRILEGADGTEFCLVVADGLGGHSGGALAAETVVETVERCWAEWDRSASPQAFLRHVVRACHDAVNRERDRSGLDPRSTLAMLVGHSKGLTSVHAGDSRVMQFNRLGLVKRTLDHSVAQLQILMKAISEEELNSHPNRNKLTTQIGGDEEPSAEIQSWDVSAGCRFVVCSDGFWELFTAEEIQAMLKAADRGAFLANRFEERLEQCRKQDNTTAILAEVHRLG